MEAHIWTPLGVEAHQFLQSGRFHDTEARLSSEGAGLPVLRGADRVSEQALQGEGSPDLNHTLTKYTIGIRPLQYETGVKLQRINVTVVLLQPFGHVFVI